MRGTKHLLKTLTRHKTAIEVTVPKEIDAAVDLTARETNDAYHNSIYKGRNDIDVYGGRQGDGWTIIALGRALLFIEFGTGITYKHDNPIDHPDNEPASWSAMHGEYLTDPEKLREYKGAWPLAHGTTRGNPSANVMYETSKRLEHDIPAIITKIIERAGK